MWLFSRVSPQMRSQAPFLSEAERTVRTLERLLPRVRPDVILEVGSEGGAVGAVWALVGLGAGCGFPVARHSSTPQRLVFSVQSHL